MNTFKSQFKTRGPQRKLKKQDCYDYSFIILDSLFSDFILDIVNNDTLSVEKFKRLRFLFSEYLMIKKRMKELAIIPSALKYSEV